MLAGIGRARPLGRQAESAQGYRDSSGAGVLTHLRSVPATPGTMVTRDPRASSATRIFLPIPMPASPATPVI